MCDKIVHTSVAAVMGFACVLIAGATLSGTPTYLHSRVAPAPPSVQLLNGQSRTFIASVPLYPSNAANPSQSMDLATSMIAAPSSPVQFSTWLACAATALASSFVTYFLVRSNNRRPQQALAMFAASGRQSKAQESTEYVLQMPGITAPTGFFDPAGLSRMKTPAQLKYAREAEIKHGRVAMLAAIGFPFAEEFHPIFPEDSVPSDFSFQLTPLQTYWPLVVLGVGLLETFSISTFKELNDGTWELKDDHVSGDLGFDPLNLRPSDPEKYLRLQNKELNNGRLAMIAIAGMVAEELVVQMDVLQASEIAVEKDLKALEALAGLSQSLAMFAYSGARSHC